MTNYRVRCDQHRQNMLLPAHCHACRTGVSCPVNKSRQVDARFCRNCRFLYTEPFPAFCIRLQTECFLIATRILQIQTDSCHASRVTTSVQMWVHELQRQPPMDKESRHPPKSGSFGVGYGEVEPRSNLETVQPVHCSCSRRLCVVFYKCNARTSIHHTYVDHPQILIEYERQHLCSCCGWQAFDKQKLVWWVCLHTK